MATKTHKIMVYGTLKKGHGNNRLLDTAKFLGLCITVDKFCLMDFGGFPGLYPKGPVSTQVKGELWEVDDATLEHCDRLEGHPNWYKRTPIKVMVQQDGRDMGCTDCEVYMQDPKNIHGTPCEDGFWPRNRKLQEA